MRRADVLAPKPEDGDDPAFWFPPADPRAVERGRLGGLAKGKRNEKSRAEILAAQGTYSEIAARFGVSRNVVSGIKHRGRVVS